MTSALAEKKGKMCLSVPHPLTLAVASRTCEPAALLPRFRQAIALGPSSWAPSRAVVRESAGEGNGPKYQLPPEASSTMMAPSERPLAEALAQQATASAARPRIP